MTSLLGMSSALTYLDEANAVLMHSWTGNYWNDIWYFPERYQIWYMQEGKGMLTFSHRTVQLQTGDVYFICPGQLNKGKPAPDHHWSVVYLSIDVTYLHTLLTSLAKPVSMLPAIADQLLSDRVLNRFLGDYLAALIPLIQQTPPAVTRSALIDQALRFFLLAFNDLVLPLVVRPHQAVARTIHYLHQHYQRRIQLDELAQEACLSKFRLLRTFTAHTGLSPHQFQLQLRLNAARRMLHQERCLTDIAFELGFTDLPHFVNTFKRYAQFSPRQYQRRVGSLIVP